MTDSPTSPLVNLFRATHSLSERLRQLHQRLLPTVPSLDRIACALYDATEDRLKTFIHSTRHGQPLQGYEWPLSESQSLLKLAETGEFRVLDTLSSLPESDHPHARWLREQGYQSSFTVPMYGPQGLIGFLFFDSSETGAFDVRVQRDLVMFCSQVTMLVNSEMAMVKAMLASTQVARDFANLRDFETGAHLERMARYAKLIARGVAAHYQLDDEFIEHLYLFAPLHDIGKIGIPDRILLKEGRLNEHEHRLMETHVELGCALVNKIMGDFNLQSLPDSTMMRNIVACHHELLDGSGYPRGLSGDQIPIEARIVTVADIFDALTSPRPYKGGWRNDDALAELQRMAEAGQLDPLCVKALRDAREQVLKITERYQDKQLPDGPAPAAH
ncbi:HD-GYP domain-containing protein [Curvibacter sp. HBC61]|uniref:HD-GYP domain-containing protein n=1 Tax=Curvibacter cyanobacteriorum TaxID=3026422 RepID=A0ABT5MX45_9BURK|nr:HD-GYP domain-containing protein [Curvibacter sp. HBC61]MDD0837337.1 HD-GYP domain-containing protein [Curvibacter sp. HBC61]